MASVYIPMILYGVYISLLLFFNKQTSFMITQLKNKNLKPYLPSAYNNFTWRVKQKKNHKKEDEITNGMGDSGYNHLNNYDKVIWAYLDKYFAYVIWLNTRL